MLRKEIDLIEESDIRQLLKDHIGESLTLEFKRQLNIIEIKDKAEVAKEISPMANSAGGFILYGIDEEDRKATAIRPMRNENQVECLDQVLASAISPQPTYRLRWLDVAQGGILIIQVWPSKYDLHMVTAYELKKGRFYKRTEAGAELMSEADIRASLESAWSRPTGFEVLVVEDSAAMLSFVASTVREIQGVDVIEATSGFEALKELPRHTFNVIITDIIIPDINGLELIRFIRKHERHQKTPLIVITADPSSQERCMALGASAFLVKPFTPSVLKDLVQRYLKGE
jgi:two-component system, chemotaxis family, chemotaxis protein CheY